MEQYLTRLYLECLNIGSALYERKELIYQRKELAQAATECWAARHYLPLRQYHHDEFAAKAAQLAVNTFEDIDIKSDILKYLDPASGSKLLERNNKNFAELNETFLKFSTKSTVILQSRRQVLNQLLSELGNSVNKSKYDAGVTDYLLVVENYKIDLMNFIAPYIFGLNLDLI